MRLFLSGLLMVMIAACASPAQQTTRRVVTRTRLQVLFSDLESQWLTAVQHNDKAALDGLLTDEFTVWSSKPPGDPMPREEWQAEAFAHPPQSFQLRQMAVRAVSANIAIASFRLAETMGSGAQARRESYFVVDVWNKVGKGDEWRCSDRYLSRVPEETQPKGDVKPTGKD